MAGGDRNHTPDAGMPLSNSTDRLRIHREALSLLRDPGLDMELPPDRLDQLAACRGVHVASREGRIRLDPEPVLETIRQFAGAATPDIDENGTDRPPQPLRFPRRLIAELGSTHGFVFDAPRGALRPATHDDIRNFIKLRRALPDVRQDNIGMLPQDVPAAVSYIHTAALNALYQNGAPSHYCNGIQDAPWLGRIADVLGRETSATNFIPAVPLVTPPLRYPAHSVEAVLYALDRGYLPLVLTMGILCGNGPVTVAGALTVTLAELFGFNTLVRLLAQPPNNVFPSRSLGCDMALLEPRRAHLCSARPEPLLLRLALRQMMGEFYKLPGGSGCVVAHITDAAEPGIQASLEHALTAASELARGFYSYDAAIRPSLKSIGRLQTNLCLCPEQALIDYDMFQWLNRLAAGAPVTGETLALDAIRTVGPGGSFLACDHTLDHYTTALWEPDLLHTGPWKAWLDSGRQSPLERARRRVEDIFRRPLDPVLPPDACRAIAQIVVEAERALLGAPTGIGL